MASNEGNDDKSSKMFREAIRCFNGTLDFAALAEKMEVANAEAMRKRFKRAFEKDPEGPINVKGNQIGESTVASTPQVKTPRTPKTPGGRKRKADEVKEDVENGADEQIKEPNEDFGNAVTDNLDIKPPQTPKAPKSAGRAKAKKATATTKSAKGKKAVESKDEKAEDMNGNEEMKNDENAEVHQENPIDNGNLAPAAKKQKVDDVQDQYVDAGMLLEMDHAVDEA